MIHQFEYKNLKLQYNLLVDGQFSQAMGSLAQLGEENVFEMEGDKIKINASYENQKLIINGKEMPPDYQEHVNENLEQIDEMYKTLLESSKAE